MANLPQPWIVRPARARDQFAIRALLTGFQRESSRALSSLQITLLGVLVGLFAAIAIHAVLTTSGLGLIWLQQVVQQVVSLALIIGFSLVVARFFNQDWRYYWVVECDGQVIGCTRLRTYDHYSVLTNLIVASTHRRQGYGSRLVQAIATQAKLPLYLSCLPSLLPLYTRLGFEPVSPLALSTTLKYDLNLFSNAQVVPLVLH
jgi:N-acetylglutamate synthase-like GNAT family acetyltransferase